MLQACDHEDWSGFWCVLFPDWRSKTIVSEACLKARTPCVVQDKSLMCCVWGNFSFWFVVARGRSEDHCEEVRKVADTYSPSTNPGARR